MKGVAQTVKFLADVERHEEKFGIVNVMAGLKNSGDRELLRQNHFTQLINGFFFLLSFRVLEFFNAIENLAKVSGRIDRQFVTDVDLQFAREIDSKHGRFAVEIEFAVFNEFAQLNDVLFLRRIDAADQRRQPAILKFHDYRTLHIRRSRNDARDVVDLRFERTPIAQNVFGRDENVRVKIDHLLPQLAVEAGHDRDHEK